MFEGSMILTLLNIKKKGGVKTLFYKGTYPRILLSGNKRNTYECIYFLFTFSKTCFKYDTVPVS